MQDFQIKQFYLLFLNLFIIYFNNKIHILLFINYLFIL